MAYKTHILLGKITKVHGYQGAVNIRLERNFSDNIPEMESVFIETDGRPVPFFIEYSEQPDFSTLRLKFLDYNSTEKVKEFIGCRVYFTQSGNLGPTAENLNDLTDYEVLSDEGISIGVVTELIENPGQFLLVIKTSSGKELLLPLHEDLVKEIIHEKRIIRMIIPQGIGDIN
jgi:16S rRNA processing protein RimM